LFQKGPLRQMREFSSFNLGAGAARFTPKRTSRLAGSLPLTSPSGLRNFSFHAVTFE
jgi:hypothetical protein